MNFCFKVPAEAWRQLRDARWEKLQKADFFRCFDNRSEGAEGADILLAALARCSQLQELDMQLCYKVPAEAWRQLRDARWEKLQKADFSWCFNEDSQGAEGADILLAALARCSQLQELGMNFCFKVPAEAWRQLRDARWEKLQKADFFRCFGPGSQGVDGADILLAALARCSALQELNMKYCDRIPAEAWEQLSDGVWPALLKQEGVPERLFRRA
ncbi:unnamed protein product [Symbiodinium natans]|uniref:Uncharacterized protein n=1 Tax=Symbiodinium natans TaxID=878477 RepID=A0A812H764_9DINO|nr:unnamed protein product [Symbiodinium natans]